MRLQLNQYVPILWAKEGEFRAIRFLDPAKRSRLTPLFQVRPRGSGDRPLSTPSDWAADLKTAWDRVSRPLFVQLMQGTGDSWTQFDQEALAQDLPYITVVRVQDDDDLLAVCGQIATRRTGAVIRVELMPYLQQDADPLPHVDEAIEIMGQSESRITLLLDLGNASLSNDADSLADALQPHFRSIADRVSPFGSVVLASGAFPSPFGLRGGGRAIASKSSGSIGGS